MMSPAAQYAVPKLVLPDATTPRDRRLIYAWTRPINVLINQNSFSNAEIFAHAIQTIGRGKLIGTATFGGVISTGAERLIDGTTVRTPGRGWYLPDGSDQENNGARPDVPVEQTPQDEAALDRFAMRYDAHIAAEEGMAYPAAAALLPPAALEVMGREMAARRGAA